MDPAVVVVFFFEEHRVYNNAHGYCNPCKHSWHDPDMHTALIKIRRQLQSNRGGNCSSKGRREIQKHHQTRLTDRKHPNAPL